jgi:hypothetical protein
MGRDGDAAKKAKGKGHRAWSKRRYDCGWKAAPTVSNQYSITPILHHSIPKVLYLLSGVKSFSLCALRSAPCSKRYDYCFLIQPKFNASISPPLAGGDKGEGEIINRMERRASRYDELLLAMRG